VIAMSTGSHDLAPNYEYWQRHGEEWADEYDARKTRTPLYHLQELMLAIYMAESAPVTVLEFGCGVGRHLRYLSQLSGVDAYGYDQSATMVDQCRRWIPEDWLREHVTVGAPLASLPYPDGHFDIVFTAEVLVHVRPQDVAGVLSELHRVARWQLLHLEPSPGYPVQGAIHAGSWSHDLPAIYRQLGHRCETLPGGYTAHSPYRVVKDASRSPYTWPPVLLSLCRRMERDLAQGFGESEREARTAVQAEREASAALAASHDAVRRADEARQEVEARLRATEAAAAEQSREAQAMIDDLHERLQRIQARQRSFLDTLQERLSRDRHGN